MEETRWLTKTKIIVMSSLVLIAGLMVIFVAVHKHNLKRKYMEYESQLEYAAPNYLLKEQISLKENEWREIKVRDILKQKLITNSKSSDCDGYVIAQGHKSTNLTKSDKSMATNNITYKAYIKCKNIYTTEGYGTKGTTGIENNEATQTQNDTQKPKITIFGDKIITLKVGEKYVELGALATDNVDGDITKKIKISGKVDTKKAGTYKIKYTVSDSSKNKASVTRVVVVEKKEKQKVEEENLEDEEEDYEEEDYEEDYEDTTPPIITFKNPSLYQTICEGSHVDISVNGPYGYVARDNVDGDITSNVDVYGDTDEIYDSGTYVIYYEVYDDAGNQAEAIKEFTVKKCGSSIPKTTTVIPITSLSVTPNTKRINVGDTFTLQITIVPSNATNKSITYSSSNNGIATVDSNGIVRGVSKGTTTITVTSNNNKKGICTVTVQ